MLVALAGCVVTRSGGQKLAVPQTAVDRIGIVLQRAEFERGNTAASIGNRDANALLPQLATRMPVIFVLNRIDSKAAFGGATGALPVELDGFRLLLRVWPQAATWNSTNGSTLTFGAELFDRETRLIIWRGSVLYGTSFYGSPDAALADKLAAKLLAQMRHDGVIMLRTAEPLLTAPVSPTAAASAASNPARIAAAERTASRAVVPSPSSTQARGVPSAHSLPVPPATSYAAIDDIDAVPVTADGKQNYRLFLTLQPPKVFIVSAVGGRRFWFKDPDAISKALDVCKRVSNPCWLYAVDDRVVWDADVEKRIRSVSQLAH